MVVDIHAHGLGIPVHGVHRQRQLATVIEGWRQGHHNTPAALHAVILQDSHGLVEILELLRAVGGEASEGCGERGVHAAVVAFAEDESHACPCIVEDQIVQPFRLVAVEKREVYGVEDMLRLWEKCLVVLCFSLDDFHSLCISGICRTGVCSRSRHSRGWRAQDTARLS